MAVYSEYQIIKILDRALDYVKDVKKHVKENGYEPGNSPKGAAIEVSYYQLIEDNETVLYEHAPELFKRIDSDDVEEEELFNAMLELIAIIRVAQTEKGYEGLKNDVLEIKTMYQHYEYRENPTITAWQRAERLSKCAAEILDTIRWKIPEGLELCERTKDTDEAKFLEILIDMAEPYRAKKQLLIIETMIKNDKVAETEIKKAEIEKIETKKAEIESEIERLKEKYVGKPPLRIEKQKFFRHEYFDNYPHLFNRKSKIIENFVSAITLEGGIKMDLPDSL